jgi:ANTAR domain/GAF domain
MSSSPRPELDQSGLGLASLFAEIGLQLLARSSTSTLAAMDAVAQTAVAVVPGAEYAGITRRRNGAFETLAPTHQLVEDADAIQYELRSGPCLDALTRASMVHADDIGTDPRWPAFGPRAAAETGVRSMLSYRLVVDDDELVAGLNLYAAKQAAFTRTAEVIGTLVATHGALAVIGASTRERASQLEHALVTSRDIGVAMGVLMARHMITRSQAFDLLRIASQHTNRKLADLARVVADTGSLPLPTTDT